MGKILGLQWANVHIDGPYAAAGEAHLRVDRELRRCSNESIAAFGEGQPQYDHLQVSPGHAQESHHQSCAECTQDGEQQPYHYLPQAVIDELRIVKARQEQYKAMLGEEYQDYDLVVAQINGRPYEQRIIDKMFYKLGKFSAPCGLS